ncbi:M23 family metallopeptidase [Candidatus Peregrinibacteria bacterium]|nr:MAG: M23 family metallopeptidase [Candidatus Peregrinibacteria bacterium]
MSKTAGKTPSPKGLKRKIETERKTTSRPSLTRQFLKRITVASAALLFILSVFPTYEITAGFNPHTDELTVFEYTERNAEQVLTDIMTEDGFLLKPSIQTTESDRSGFSDIFVYTVEPGYTLSSIAQRFSLKKETLMGENDLWNPNLVRAGMQLKIPPVDGLSHSVQKGDTVASLAKKYKVERDVIIAQNQLDDTPLEIGTMLIIPGATRQAPAPATKGRSSVPTAPNAAPGNSAAVASGKLIWPVSSGYKVTQYYQRSHAALDIANRNKGPIYAAASGKVIKAGTGWNGGYGNVIIIDHGDGMQTLYAHNEKLYVTEGQYVDQGQTIAWMGNTGRVYGQTGIHLHFEVRVNGIKYNPMSFY